MQTLNKVQRLAIMLHLCLSIIFQADESLQKTLEYGNTRNCARYSLTGYMTGTETGWTDTESGLLQETEEGR